MSSKETQINHSIRDREVRVVGHDGVQLGVMSSVEARNLAEQQELDLVKIAPQASPPVCKIMDYGKFRFDQSKREKEAKKNQRLAEVKEVRLSLRIDTHDLDTKLRNARKFLDQGSKVKVSIFFRGREMGHSRMGLEVMQRFAEQCADIATVEKPAKLEGRSMLMFLLPKSK